MSQVVTELVIDADTSGVDRFSAAMDRAADSTQGVSSSISGTLLAIAGIGGGMIAAVAGISGVVDQVVSANKELADMQSMWSMCTTRRRAFNRRRRAWMHRVTWRLTSS